jgi:hypothetical protein
MAIYEGAFRHRGIRDLDGIEGFMLSSKYYVLHEDVFLTDHNLQIFPHIKDPADRTRIIDRWISERRANDISKIFVGSAINKSTGMCPENQIRLGRYEPYFFEDSDESEELLKRYLKQHLDPQKDPSQIRITHADYIVLYEYASPEGQNTKKIGVLKDILGTNHG